MAEQLVVLTPGATELVEVALQGPPGPPGPAGAPGGALLQITAAVDLGGHLAVAYDASGRLVLASADNAGHALRVAGITTGAAVASAAATVQRNDVLEHAGWAWTPGAPVFLGLAGQLVQSVPPGAVFAQVLGHALTPTRLLINLQPSVLLS